MYVECWLKLIWWLSNYIIHVLARVLVSSCGIARVCRATTVEGIECVVHVKYFFTCKLTTCSDMRLMWSSYAAYMYVYAAGALA